MTQNTQVAIQDIKITPIWRDHSHYKNSVSILIVDDSIVLRSILRNALLEKQFDVLSARDAEEGCRILEGNAAIDLIITDFHMPGLDGAAFIEKVRANSRHSTTPILVLTTGTDDEDKLRARDAGASGWIVKPFDTGKLAAAIHILVPDPQGNGRASTTQQVPSPAASARPKRSMLKVRYDSGTGMIHTIVDGPTDREGVETYLASLHKLMDRARSEHGLCRHLVDARNLEIQSSEALASLAGSPLRTLYPEDRTAVVMASERAIIQRSTLPPRTTSHVFREMEAARAWLLSGMIDRAVPAGSVEPADDGRRAMHR